MVNFTDGDIKYLKEQLDHVLNIWNNGTKEELKKYIDETGGKSLDTVLMVSRNDYRFLDAINTNIHINRTMSDFCFDGLGMWYWVNLDFTTSKEVHKYVGDMEYCNLYETVMFDEELDMLV